MDDRELTQAPSLFPPQTSVEKVIAAVEGFLDNPPDDPMVATMVMAAGMALPMLRGKLAAMDTADLDVILLAGAKWCFGLRSDTAHVPADLDELFLGPDPDADA